MRLRSVVRVTYEFIAGDDGTIPLGVIVALAVTGWTAHNTVLPAWWIVAAAILVLLPLSVGRAVRAALASRSCQPPAS
jgi:hypothetical protein